MRAIDGDGERVVTDLLNGGEAEGYLARRRERAKERASETGEGGGGGGVVGGLHVRPTYANRNTSRALAYTSCPFA